MVDDVDEDSEAQETSNQNPTTEATEVQETSENDLTSSQVNTNECMHSNIAENNQHVNDIESHEFISLEKRTEETLEIVQEFVEKIPITNSELIGRPSRSLSKSDIPLNETHSLGVKETEDQSTQEESMSVKSPIATLSTHLEMEKTSSGPLLTPLQKEIKRNVEEETTSSVYGKKIASPIDSESEDDEGQIAIPSSSVVKVEPASTKDVAKSVIPHSETNAPVSDNLSQITKDSNSIAIVTMELEQLVSNKHLALENLSLLIDFLVKNPSVRLTNNAISDRYKGFAYTCLVELLKFLQTHSVLDVLGSNHSEFVGLLQDMRTFGFDKNWLDGVERCAFFPALPLSENALQNILHSKHTLIQHFENLKNQMEESIIQQETQLLEVKATLSTPLGY